MVPLSRQPTLLRPLSRSTNGKKLRLFGAKAFPLLILIICASDKAAVGTTFNHLCFSILIVLLIPGVNTFYRHAFITFIKFRLDQSNILLEILFIKDEHFILSYKVLVYL